MSVKKIFTEIVTVIIGILIALFINNWKQDFDNKKFIQGALNSIHNEIEESQASVEKIVERHYALADTIGTNLNDSRSIRELIQQSGGVQYPIVKNIGLRFFVSSKAELMDYEVISTLTEIEYSTNLMDKKFDKLMDYAYESMENTDEKSKMMFIIHLSNVVDSEDQLLELYEGFLDNEKK